MNLKSLICFVLALTGFIGLSQNINSGLVGYYPFDGNANDYSGNGLHGVSKGALLTEGCEGIENTAYDFSSGPILVDRSFDFNSEEWSLSFWVHLDSLEGRSDNYILKFTNYSSLASDWETDPDNGTYRASILKLSRHGANLPSPSCTTYTCSVSNPEISNAICNDYLYLEFNQSNGFKFNEWHHIVYKFKSGVLEFYVNGSFVSQVQDWNSGNTYELINQFGAVIGSQFKGKMDQLRFYNREISPSEISLLYQEMSVITFVKRNNFVSELEIYPNPVTSILFLKQPIILKELYVTNTVGNIINVEFRANQVDVSKLASGNYFLRVVDSNDNVSTLRFVKE